MKVRFLRGVLVALTLTLTGLGTATYGQDTAGGSKGGGGKPASSNSGLIIRRSDVNGGADRRGEPGAIAPRSDPFGIQPSADPFTISRVGGPPPGLLGPPVIAPAEKKKQQRPVPSTGNAKPSKKNPGPILRGPTADPVKPKPKPEPPPTDPITWERP
jgi:hypothetical protein